MKILKIEKVKRDVEIRKLKDFPLYSISIDGEVFSLKKNGIKKLRNSNHAFDYEIVNLKQTNGKFVSVLVHQLVMMAWGPARPRPYSEFVITHLDKNKKNNHVSNLAWIRKTDIRANRTKPVRALGIDEGDKILFRTTTDAAKYFHTNQVKIKEVCENNLIFKGYKFEYIIKN